MLQCSYDPDSRALYIYFVELEEGRSAYVFEYPAALLLDAAGRVFGVAVDLDDEVLLSMLEAALEPLYNWLDGEHGRLIVRFADEEPARVLRLASSAILDLDNDDLLLGMELELPADLPETALERLQPFMIALEDLPVAPGDGPVTFAAPADDDEADLDDDEADLDDDEADLDDDEADADDEEADDDEEAADDTVDVVAPSPVRSAALDTTPIRAGFVALVGKPNVGKSTLLNALLGEKVAIVSPRPQTTRVPARGILSRPGAQIVFVDTPGIHKPSHRLGRMMVDLAERSLPGADVIGFMVDISRPPSALDQRIAQQVMRARAHKLLILNKVDLRPRESQGYLEQFRALGEWELELAISARRKLGLGTLLEQITLRLPLGPALYPQDQLTDQTEQQMAAEFVREQVLRATQDEVPHAVAIEVEEWEEKDAATYIRMTINVEREGQKAIVIGTGGAMLKKIGSAARTAIEHMLGRTVYLDLWVKVRPNWRDDPTALGWLGLQARNFTS